MLTDFGLNDGYVGAVKGAILSAWPSARLVDITHLVPPLDVHHGAYVLGTASGAFPSGTVHLAVVDPGVGTSRRGLVVSTRGHLFVGPDNGLMTYVLWPDLVRRRHHVPLLAPMTTRLPGDARAYVLDRPEFWRQGVSPTFHARDIFGPVAAHLASGVPPESVGSSASEVTALYVPRPAWSGHSLHGVVLHVDRFGNLMTNIAGKSLEKRWVDIEVGGRRVRGLVGTYGDAAGLAAMISSNRFLEIAITNGNAGRELGVGVGETVVVRPARRLA